MDIESDLGTLTAAECKNAGNKLCALHRYEEAIDFYSKAISKSPEVPIFYSNKALCYLKLHQFQLAIQECRRALEIDPNLIKAHIFLGQALSETENFDDALKHLQRAHELAKEKQLNFGDDITYQIRLAKRQRWNKIEEENAKLEDELQNYLVNLVLKDKESKMNLISERLETLRLKGSTPHEKRTPALGDPTSYDTIEQPISPDVETNVALNDRRDDDDGAEIELVKQRLELNAKCDTYMERLTTMFNDLKLKRKKRDVPDHLCGKISFEIMHDPVITPSGITYDRQDIEEHLRRVGHFDPITRQPLTSNQLIPNLAMKEVVDAYLNENEWANYY